MKFKHYEVTGLLYQSKKRFKKVYSDIRWAMGINLWRGSVWGVKEDGKRKLLKRI